MTWPATFGSGRLTSTRACTIGTCTEAAKAPTNTTCARGRATAPDPIVPVPKSAVAVSVRASPHDRSPTRDHPPAHRAPTRDHPPAHRGFHPPARLLDALQEPADRPAPRDRRRRLYQRAPPV